MHADKEQLLADLLVCPACRANLALQPEGPTLRCQNCGACYPQVEGIWRLLTEQQADHYQPFMAAYRPLRQAEGWERADSNYYLNLPNVPATDPQAAIWRIRQRSLRRVEQLAGAGNGKWALDLGAGNGWLSRRLVKLGFQVVALDLNAAGPDSLAGGSLFQQHDHSWFGRVQASMEDLPFRSGAFRLIVSSGAVHYTALPLTLKAVGQALEPGGQFIISDSPVYKEAGAGQQMAAEYQKRASQRFGYEAQWVGGSGFLVEETLVDELRRQGFEITVYPVERKLGHLKREVLRRIRPQPKREEAHFPVIVGRKLRAAN